MTLAPWHPWRGSEAEAREERPVGAGWGTARSSSGGRVCTYVRRRLRQLSSVLPALAPTRHTAAAGGHFSCAAWAQLPPLPGTQGTQRGKPRTLLLCETPAPGPTLRSHQQRASRDLASHGECTPLSPDGHSCDSEQDPEIRKRKAGYSLCRAVGFVVTTGDSSSGDSDRTWASGPTVDRWPAGLVDVPRPVSELGAPPEEAGWPGPFSSHRWCLTAQRLPGGVPRPAAQRWWVPGQLSPLPPGHG